MISLKVAKRLYTTCEMFENGGLIGQCEFKELTKTIFGRSTVSTMQMMAAEVYRVLAKEYMKQNATGI